MIKWEYCSVETELEAVEEKKLVFYLSKKKLKAVIRYYKDTDDFVLETFDTNFVYEDNEIGDKYKVITIGFALARLGQEGWELVTYDTKTHLALLKRELL